MTETPSPEFGPGGYLPERAAKRARKIVLRAPLGLQWIAGAAVFGVVVVVAGVLWLRSSGPPGPPFVDAGVLPAAGPTVVAVDQPPVWLVVGAGPVLAVPRTAEGDLVWCDASRRVESSDGRVWSATGRGLGTNSLRSHPVVVHDGTVYVDPTVTRDGPRPSAEAATPAC